MMLDKSHIGCQSQVMPFGKYKGKDLLFIAENNPKYLLWLKSECELRGKLKDAVWQFVETSYFKECLNTYTVAEEQFIEACYEMHSWGWK